MLFRVFAHHLSDEVSEFGVVYIHGYWCGFVSGRPSDIQLNMMFSRENIRPLKISDARIMMSLGGAGSGT